MSKIRINDLARELEVKSKAILDALLEVGVTEKKTHSSSVEEHEAEKVRAYLRAASEAQSAPKQSRPSRVDSDEIKTKIDLSNISRPGDVLNAIRKQQAPVSAPASPVRPSASASPMAPSVSTVKAPPAPPPTAAVPTPRIVLPQSTVRPTFSAPAPPVVQAPATAVPSPTPAPVRTVHPPAGATPTAAQAAAPSSVTAAPVAPPQSSAPPAAKPTGPIVPSRPQAPSPRMIVPHTGPRPVYKAPVGIVCANGSGGSNDSSGSRAPRSRAANFPAPTSRWRHSSGCPSTVTPGRASPDASDSEFTDGYATARSWTRFAAAGHDATG